jgi:LuxR family maltose regulon positive regulatory protein
MDSTYRKSIPLINTKFSIPRINSGLIHRPQLIERLNEGLNRKLTLVCAPAGYGKTTLISQWLVDGSRPIAWLSLDENDNDLIVFLNYIVKAIQTKFPEVGRAILSELEAPQKLPLEHLTVTLINELTEMGKPFMLILDDYHNIIDPSVHQLVDALIAYMPPDVHLVLVSRRDFPLPLVRLRIGREMTEIRTKELKFNNEEAKAYLEQTTGMEMSLETITDIERHTEGWIAALRLAAIAIPHESDLDRFVSSFKGSHYELMKYLVNEVLSQQSEVIQSFLLRTSILDRFCAPLCDVMIDSPSTSQGLLDYLESNNLFIVPLDNERTWYRYHHLFQDMLRHRLRINTNETNIQELHHRASLWLSENNYDEEALRHALVAGEVEQAVDLVRHQYHNLVNREDWREIDHWLGMLPDEVVKQQPSLLVMQGWSLLFKFQLTAIPPLLQHVEKLLDRGAGELSKTEERLLRAEMDVQHSFVYALSLNDIKKSLDCGKRALNILPKSHATGYGLARGLVSVALQEMGRGEEAINALTENINDPTAENAVIMQAYIALCFIHLSSANLYRLSQLAQNFLITATDMEQLPEIAWSHYFIGLTSYEWGDLERAAKHFTKGIELRYKADFITGHLNMLAQAMTYMAQGDIANASEIIMTLREFSLELKTTRYLTDIDSLQARFAIYRGDNISAQLWVDSVTLDEERENFTALEIPSLTWARICIQEREPESIQEAIDILNLRLLGAENRHNTRRQIQTLAHLALAYHAVGQTEEALGILERAIIIAQPGGFIRTFVDIGPQMSGMLLQLASQGVAVHYIKRILSAFPESEIKQVSLNDDPAYLVRESSKTILVEPLTRRESEILLQMSARFTNKEIADNLTISILTVKKHTGNIYRKLGVKKRGEAVDKAKALGILST